MAVLKESSVKIVKLKHLLVKHKLSFWRAKNISTKCFHELASEVAVC